MIKKIALALALPVAMMGFTACGANTTEDEYVAVCVNPETQERLEDDACQDGDSDFLTYAVIWYMLANSSHSYPAVGGHVNKSHYKTTKPKGVKTHFGLPKSGGTSVKSYASKTSWGKSSFGSGSKSGSSGFGGGSKSGSGFKSGGTSGGFKSGGRR